jgi:hypothetical protein
MKFPSYTIFTEKANYSDSFGPIIRINPKYKYHPDLAIYEHEHVKQWHQLTLATFSFYIMAYLLGSVFLSLLLTHFILHSFALIFCASLNRLLYKYSTSYRQYTEVKAFAKQIKFLCEEHTFRPEKRYMYINHFSNVLSTGYKLDISYEKAQFLINKELA